MINCIKNEIIKLIHNKKLIICIFALLILVGFNIVYMYTSSFDKTPSEQLKKKEDLVIELKAQLKSEELSKEKKQNINMQVKRLDEEIKTLKYSIANPSEDWKRIVENKIKNLQEAKGKLSEDLDSTTVERYNAEIQYYNYLLNNNIQPSKEYKLYAFEDIIKIFDFINKMILPILIAFICSDIIAGEYSHSTIKVLLTKPVSRKKILLSKFLANIIVVAIAVYIIQFISFVILGCIFNFGTPLYPVVIGTNYIKNTDSVYINNLSAIIGSSYIIPVWKMILFNLCTQLAFIVVCVSFVMCISTIFTNNIISLTISFGILMFTVLITYIWPLKFLNKLYPILFTTYSCGTDILKGNLALNLNSPGISMYFALGTMAVWTVLCYYISSNLFNKRDVL